MPFELVQTSSPILLTIAYLISQWVAGSYAVKRYWQNSTRSRCWSGMRACLSQISVPQIAMLSDDQLHNLCQHTHMRAKNCSCKICSELLRPAFKRVFRLRHHSLGEVLFGFLAWSSGAWAYTSHFCCCSHKPELLCHLCTHMLFGWPCLHSHVARLWRRLSKL